MSVDWGPPVAEGDQSTVARVQQLRKERGDLMRLSTTPHSVEGVAYGVRASEAHRTDLGSVFPFREGKNATTPRYSTRRIGFDEYLGV